MLFLVRNSDAFLSPELTNISTPSFSVGFVKYASCWKRINKKPSRDKVDKNLSPVYFMHESIKCHFTILTNVL